MKYLRLRGKNYQFERPVPKDIQPILGLKSWRESLGTDSRSNAEALCRKRTVHTDDIIQRARNGSLRRLTNEMIDSLAVSWSQDFQDANRENIPRDMFPDVFQDEPDIRETPDSTIFSSRKALEANVKRWVEKEGVDIQFGSPDWETLIDECYGEYVTANPEISDQWFGVLQDRGIDLDERYRNAFKVAPRPKKTNPKSKVGEVFKKYVADSDLGPSGLSGTKESDLGFRSGFLCASHADAQKNILHGLKRGTIPA